MYQFLFIMKNIHYAIISGLCASAASAFGKLSGLPILEGYFIARVTFFVMMLVSNAVVWTFFAKALQQSDSLTATVVSSASNYIFSALCGYFLFHEVTSLLWWTGMFFIIIGLVLVISDQSMKLRNEELVEENGKSK